jgi:homospermidine synthase
MKAEFSGNIVIFGSGAVSRCLQTILRQHSFDCSSILIIEPDATAIDQSPLKNCGTHFLQKSVTQDNYLALLTKHVKPGDIIIDLSVGIDTQSVIEWCQENNVRFINTSIECWPLTTPEGHKGAVSNRSLASRQAALLQRSTAWINGPTAVVEHGANPGLVSHWTKKALENITKIILKQSDDKDRNKHLEKELNENNFAQLAYLTGTKVIHISERDTQIANEPKRVNEFVNTWSIPGLCDEGMAPAELGWGTHEKQLPADAQQLGPNKNDPICLSSMGMNTFMYSWVPSGDIIGALICHGEAISIPRHLTVWENNEVIYRPTVHYVYVPSDSTAASLNELRMRNYKMQPSIRVLYDEIISGRDEVGVLLLGHDLNGWWEGSRLTIEETRKLVGPGNNATTLQVAASMFGAIMWMIKNPNKGLCFPDDLPYKEILAVADPYLGECASVQTDWTPAKVHGGHNGDTWQFSNFVFVRHEED